MILKIALLLHIISAIFWVGGMLFLVLVIAPFLKTIPDPKAKSQIFQVVGKQYRFWGWVAKITLVTIIVISALVHDFWIGPKARNSAKHARLARIFGRTNLIIALLIVLF